MKTVFLQPFVLFLCWWLVYDVAVILAQETSLYDGIINQTIIMSVEQQEITIPGRSPPCSRNR